jgi:hypothetical protein
VFSPQNFHDTLDIGVWNKFHRQPAPERGVVMFPFSKWQILEKEKTGRHHVIPYDR